MKRNNDIADSRSRLSEIDREIVELIAERQQIVKTIGRAKQSQGKALRDFNREKVVFETALERARALDLNPRMVEDIVRTLIQYSLEHQERDFVSSSNKWGGKRALVIGGLGGMGRWFAETFKSQKFVVHIADPASTADDDHFRSWRQAGVDYDVIVVATPIAVMNRILLDLADAQPTGLVIDVSSLKTPIRSRLRKLAAAGCKVASLHPMFGPDTQLLSGKHMVFVDAGSETATEDAKELFANTMVEMVDMALDDHDRLISYVLGLAHALNIVFFHVLANSGEAAARLIKLSSSTFDAQLLISAAVARENPEMYFDIQHLNEFGSAALEEMCRSSEFVRDLIADGDKKRFIDAMQEGHKYFSLRRRPESEPSIKASRRRRYAF